MSTAAPFLPSYLRNPPPLATVAAFDWRDKEAVAELVWAELTAELKADWNNDSEEFCLAFCRRTENFGDYYDCILAKARKARAAEAVKHQKMRSEAQRARAIKAAEIERDEAEYAAATTPIERQVWMKFDSVRAEFSGNYKLFQTAFARCPQDFAAEVAEIRRSNPAAGYVTGGPLKRITVNEKDASACWKGSWSLRNEFGGDYPAFLAAFKTNPAVFLDEIQKARGAA